MASYFGEVIQPSSRAFWNDENDDENLVTQENVNFVINWIEPEPVTIQKFILIEGDMINDFASSCLLQNAKIACQIKNELNGKISSTIYSYDTGLYICTIDVKFDLTQSGIFTKLIAPLLAKSKYVYAVTSDHISHFKSKDEISTPSFLKCLYSQKAKSSISMNVSFLNQPNIVTGVCAGVLSYAEVTNSHCIMYILYTDIFTLDSKNAVPLTELFSNILDKCIPNFTAEISSCFDKGNLYY